VRAQYLAQRQAQIMFTESQMQAERLGVDPAALDVLGELVKLADEALRWKQVCAALVGHVEEVRYKTGSGEQVRGEIQLYTASLERAARILTDLARLNVQDRYVSQQKMIAEGQVDWTVQAIDATLRALGHDPQDRQIAAVVAEQLRLVDTETADAT
jgi:hypothetical protein